MAGFMSPSGFGAFVSGFARQANQNIEEQKLEDRQNDIIWFNKFERGLSEYNKEKDKNDQISQVYNTYLRESGGNKRLTNAAINAYITNPKGEGYMQGLYLIAQNKDNPSMADTGDEQSSFMSNMQGTLGAKYQHLQDIRSSMRPQAQRFTQMPSNAPGELPQYQPAQQNIGTTQPLGNNPSDMVPATGTGLDQQIGNAPNTGEIPLDTQPNTNTPTQSTTQIPGMTNPPAQQTASGMILPPNRVDSTAQHQRNLEDISRQHNAEIARHNKVIEGQKPATPEDAANAEIEKKDAESYLHDPKTGVQARMQTARDAQSLNYDVTSIASALNRGLKANAVQPAYDELNRFTTALLGVDLATMGISNQVSDVNTLKKNVANGIINRLSQLHFGRITNKEVDYVNSGFVSTKNDPDTNLKIILALQHYVQAGIKDTYGEWQAIYGPNAPAKPLDKVRAGREYQNSAMDNLFKSPTPWPVIKNNAEDYAKVPNNQWFEVDGHMYMKTDQGLRKAGDVIGQ